MGLFYFGRSKEYLNIASQPSLQYREELDYPWRYLEPKDIPGDSGSAYFKKFKIASKYIASKILTS